MTSADNQQERPDEGLCQYIDIAGFVDGEDSFHVAVQRSRFTRVGLQVIPEFHVSQNPDRAEVLSLIQQVLGCGYIKINHPGSIRDRSVVLVVRNRQDPGRAGRTILPAISVAVFKATGISDVRHDRTSHGSRRTSDEGRDNPDLTTGICDERRSVSQTVVARSP